MNDITKYILFRKKTKNCIDKSIILQILFAYRFIQNEFIKDIMNELGFLSMKVNPIIRTEKDYLSISLKKKDLAKQLTLHYYNKFPKNNNEMERKINTLNIKQKQCLIFLALSILCKRACIIQGDTASGKTHLIRLFAEILGQNLIVYQINKETGLSIFTGQSTLLNKLEKEEITTIENYLEILSKNETFHRHIKNEFFYDNYHTEIESRNWSVKKFNNLIQEIREYIKRNNETMEEKEYKDFKKIANELEELMQPYKRFKKQESMFIKALEKGYWILIDGIESANPVISDKLIRLCDENPELDLTETGEDIIFSNNPSHKKIHQNFHLFISYNPLNKSNNNQLTEMFLNKCITFTLSPMDADIESSARIIYGFIKNTNKINNDALCKEISSKVAIVHQAMNKKFQDNQDFFSGGVEFTGRIIKYISEELSKSKNENDLCERIVKAFYLNYINSINNKNDINNINEVKKIIKASLYKSIEFDTGEKDIYIKYSEILKILRNIQKLSKKMIKNFEFDFVTFLQLLKKVEINELDFIYYHIDETLKMLDMFCGVSIKNKLNNFSYYNLIIIKKLLRNVHDYIQRNDKYNLNDFTLNDEDELINKSILKKEIAKFNFVLKLELETKVFYLENNFIYLPDELLKYIDFITKLLETNEINYLYDILKIIKVFVDQGINITKLFPFNQILLEKTEKNSKRIRMFKIIFLIFKIIENKIDCQFGYNSDIQQFIFRNEEKGYLDNLYIIINLTKDFYLEKSKIKEKDDPKEDNSIDIPEDIEEESKISASNWFYLICLKIIKNKLQLTEQDKLTDIMAKVTDENITILDEVNQEFEDEIKGENRTYSIIKLLSKPKEDLNAKEENLIMKIWYLILFYEFDKLKLITPFFCLPFERELLEGMKNIYENMEISTVSKNISFTKKLLENNYGDHNTFLYKIQSGFFDYLSIEDKKEYEIQINNEIKHYKNLKSPMNEFWTNESSIECLKNQYINLKECIENNDKVEKYKNGINDLISKVNNFDFKGNEKYKEKLERLLRNKLSNPTQETFEICRENVDNYLRSLQIELSGNQIGFPINILNKIHYNENDSKVICLNLLKKYSSYHRSLTNIFHKSKNILSDIFNLDQEIEIIYDILSKYALEKGDYIHMYENKIMGIIRALILYNIIQIGTKKGKIQKYFDTFLELADIINDQIGGRGYKHFNEDILEWTKDKTIPSDLEDYLLLPKFESKDFLYLFLITYTEEKENNEISYISKEGFLFKNSEKEEIKTILFKSLNKYEQENLNDIEKKQFRDYMLKIGRSIFQTILPDKCDDNFNKLSYTQFKTKLEEEKKLIIEKINELKNDKKQYEIYELNLEIIEKILNCFILATSLEQNPNYPYKKLNYEDIEFFKNKIWNKNLMSKYPGMTFWLAKYYSTFYKDLMEKKEDIGCFISKDNKISFWYFQVRILSNIKTFEYNCYIKKDLEIKNSTINVGKELEDEEKSISLQNIVEKYIKEKITNLIKKNEDININWINLVLNDIPPELNIFNENLRHFYDFFALLLADSNGKQKETKNKIIIEYIKKLFDLIFQNQIDNLFMKSINNNDELILLIKKPEEELIKKIKEENQKNLLDTEIKKHIKSTQDLFSEIKSKVPKIINNIHSRVEEKTKEYHKIYVQEKEAKLKEETCKIEESFEEAKKELIDCLDTIKSKTLQQQTLLEEKIKNLRELMDSIDYFKFSSKTEIIYYKLTLDVQLRNKYLYYIKIKNKNLPKNEKIEFNSNCRHIYLQSSIFNTEDIQDALFFIKDKYNPRKININDKIKKEECSINIYDNEMKFNPEVKKRMIDNAESSIKIKETEITFNGHHFDRNKLDAFKDAVQKFNLDSLKKMDKYDINLLIKLKNILETIEDLNKYLNVKTSNEKDNDNDLENHIRKLKQYAKDCKEHLLLNIIDIKKIIDLNEKIDGGKIFLENHNENIIYHQNPKSNDPIYISNDSYLKYPMISNTAEKITFSSKAFKMFLGSYIPSTLSTPLIIKLINLKQNKLKGFIKNCNINNIVKVEENVKEKSLEIKINIHNLKSDNFLNQKINFQLEINSEGYKELLIPFNLNLNIIPFSIIFTSLDYKLTYDVDNKEFNLNSPILYANSKIQFAFNYLFKSKIENQLNNNIVNFDCSLESSENNNTIKPRIEKDEKNKLTLIIPAYEDLNNIIKFTLKIYFSTTFYINIKFNSKIFSFDFKFKWYSYNKKQFTDENINIYINTDDLPLNYTLNFKVEKFSGKTDYKFEKYLPEEFEILSNDFDKKNNKSEFIFDIKLKIKNKFYINKNYYFEVIGNQVHKKIIIKPNFFPKKTNLLKDLLDLPKYKLSSIDNNNFIEEEKIEKDSLYITPFHYYIPYVKIYYSRNNSMIDGDYEEKFNFEIYCYLYDEKKLGKKKFSYDNSQNYKNIIGIFDDNKWYPMIKMENEDDEIFEKYEYLEYKEENIEKAIDALNMKSNNYWFLPGLFFKCYNDKNMNYILHTLESHLPVSLKVHLSEEIEKLRENKEKNLGYVNLIILNNLIHKLYNLFKKKFLEIKENKYIFYLTDLKPPENITEMIKQKQSEYFKINEAEFSEIENNVFENDIDKINIEGYNQYLLQENKTPQNKEYLNQVDIIDEEKIEMKEEKSDTFDLSDIELDELKSPTSHSLNEIIKYYNDCNKIINILYFYIISASKSKNIDNQKKAGNFYQKLEYIYEKYESKKNYSFFSKDINDFIKGFHKFKYELEKIGFKLKKKNEIRRITGNDEVNYIEFPKKEEINNIKDNWNTGQTNRNNQYRLDEEQLYGKLKINKSKNIGISLIDNDDSDSEEEKINIKKIEKNKIIEAEEAKLEKIKIKISDINDDNFENNFEKEEEEETLKGDDNDKKENNIKIGKFSDELEPIDPTDIYEKNFREEDGIKRALLLLEEENRKKESNIAQNFDLGNPNKYHKFNNMDIFNIGKVDKLNIQQLYDKSSFLANHLFINVNGTGKIKYSDTLVLILLDPSVYISDEIKIMNMLIVCAMTNALNCLEIKYSIVLMGDEDFRCVLKSYNEAHSIEALERVYECLMLKRYITNIPGCLKYCLEEISSKSDFKYTSFFVFTDGLDKRFVYTQKNTWDSDIFYTKSNSFAFIFLLSQSLTNKNKIFLNEIWNKFIKETKKNSHSGIYLKNLELRIDDDFKKKITEIFVLNLVRTKYEEPSNEIKYTKPVFKINNDNSIIDFYKKSLDMLDDKSLFKLNGTFIKNDIIPSSLNTNKEPLDINYFKNNLHQIAKKNNNKFEDQENNSINFAHKFLSIRTNLNRGILDEIFKPNKANLKVLSNTGTEIDIMALILYFLNPVPDPMIYLQDAIGNIKEYAITVIIDTSFSVLNHFNINQSLNTIRVLLTSFTIIDLPSFDLIVTGENGPIILCSEYPTFAALNEKSEIWDLLCHCLSNPISNADLLSALQAAFDLKRMRTNNFPSFLFVLTDGLFDEDKQNKLRDIVAKLVQNSIQVIGIGLGSYPYGINNIFGQAVFDINPSNLFSSILSILEGNIPEKNDMSKIQKEEEKEKNIKNVISELIDNKKNKKYFYKSLREELKLSPLAINSLDMLNDEIDGGIDEFGRQRNPNGDKIGLLKENALLGQNILIVMLWSCELDSEENKLLDPKYIETINESNTKSIKSSIEYLGVNIKTVLNYEDAIKEITKKDKNGKCNYYTVWVMCGPKIKDLPDHSPYPGLVEQFIDCLLIYWNNGGSVVLLCDNEPLYFQANMFLEKIRFKGEVEKTKLRIKGNNPGTKILIRDDANGILTKNSTYDTSSMRLPNGTKRLPIGRNIPQIFEGETISYANSNEIEDIKPFIQFAKNSSGNICIMIYGTQGKEGDIIIDCGYTKFFINMSTDDSHTWRYVQNIAGFLGRPEAHMIYDDGETEINYRPNGVNFVINYSNLYTNFDSYIGGGGDLDIVYLIDSTGSMSSWLSGVKEKCKEILDKLNENSKLKNYDIKFGGVFYRDPVDSSDDKNEYQPLGDVENLKNKMNSIDAIGGGDEPEDWVGGYQLALDKNKMNWRMKSIKIIIHIADAGAHGERFSSNDKYNEYENPLVNLIQQCAREKISILGYQIGSSPQQSFSECKSIYDLAKSKDGNFDIYHFEHASDEEVAKNLKENISKHITAFINKKK